MIETFLLLAGLYIICGMMSYQMFKVLENDDVNPLTTKVAAVVWPASWVFVVAVMIAVIIKGEQDD